MIHLIYSLGVNPKTLSLLTFDAIDESGSMMYFDTQRWDYVMVNLNENLIRDINHFKEIVREILNRKLELDISVFKINLS